MPNTHPTREGWLQAATGLFTPLFAAIEAPLPPRIRLSVGFCSTGKRSKRIGECWSDTCSKDGHFEIFIRPELIDPIEVLGVQAHELIHTAVGTAAGHGKLFKRVALEVGLGGKMRATTIGPELRKVLEDMANHLGPYPHGGLSQVEMQKQRKKQTTRLIKCECEECGYTVRTTRQWINIGLPHCPNHGEMPEA